MGSVWLTTLVLVQLSLLCFTNVLAESIEAVPPIPPHGEPYYHHPAMAPSHPPSRRRHHHNHPPSPAPSHHCGHPPSHAPSHAPAHPPVAHTPVHTPKSQPSPPKPYRAPPKPRLTPVTPPAHHPSHPFPRSFVAVQGVVYCKSCNYSGVDTLLGATPLLGATVKLQCNNTKYPQEVKTQTDKNGYFFVEAPKSVTNYGAHKCEVFLVPAPTSPCGKPSNLHGGITGAILRPEKPYVAKKLPFTLFTVGPLAYEPKCKHY